MDITKTVDVSKEKGKGALRPKAEDVGPISIKLEPKEEKKEDGD